MKLNKFFAIFMAASLAFTGCDTDEGGGEGDDAPVGPGNWASAVIYDISVTEVHFDIRCANPDFYYDYRVVSKAELSTQMRTVKEDAQKRLSGYAQAIDSGYGSWTGERNPDLWGNPSVGNLKHGNTNDSWDYLMGNTDYILYVYKTKPDYQTGRVVVDIIKGRDEDGDTIYDGVWEEKERLVYVLDEDYDILRYEFTTKDPGHSDLDFEFDEEWEKCGEITIFPTNNDPYYFSVYPAEGDESIDDASDDWILDHITSTIDVSMSVLTGPSGGWAGPSMEPGMKYVVYLFGFNGGVTTELYRHYFTFEGIDRERYYSTTNKDVEFSNANGGLITFFGSGDEWDSTNTKNIYNHYYILLSRTEGNRNAEWFQTEIFTDLDKTTPEGTYTIDLTWSGLPGTALSGELNMLFENIATWWATTTTTMEAEDNVSGDEGTITIEKTGDDEVDEDGDPIVSYKITAEFKGPAGNTIKVNYEGKMNYIDASAQFGKDNNGKESESARLFCKMSNAAKISKLSKCMPSTIVKH